ncbi:hypothetical protein BKA57DRAFT_474136 [Linnemannia elongata]|nr:hypothetical protein BKA57DRAFT_474136 [Linnemannia elongata]
MFVPPGAILVLWTVSFLSFLSSCNVRACVAGNEGGKGRNSRARARNNRETESEKEEKKKKGTGWVSRMQWFECRKVFCPERVVKLNESNGAVYYMNCWCMETKKAMGGAGCRLVLFM